MENKNAFRIMRDIVQNIYNPYLMASVFYSTPYL
jgi:hypothetical protein